MNRWIGLVPLTGILFFGLLLASFIVGGSTPNSDATGQHVIAFYTAHKSKEQTSGFLGFYAVVFFLFFAGVLRARFREARPESAALAALSFGGAVLVAVGGATFASLTIALTDVPDKLDPGAAQALNVASQDFFVPLIAGSCVFMIANGIAAIRWGVLPAWLGWVAILIGVVAVTPVGFFAFLAVMVWVLIVSILLFLRGRPEQPATPSPAT